MITAQDYMTAEEQYISMSDEELGQLARKAGNEQPAIFTFIAIRYELLKEDESKDFYIQLVYSTWLAFTNKYKLKRKLSIVEVEKMDEAEEKLLSNLYDNQDAVIDEALHRMIAHPQAALIGHLYMQIGDFFEFDEQEDEEFENDIHRDSGILTGVINLFVNLLEKSRQSLYISQSPAVL
jgi:hypothetical protein